MQELPKEIIQEILGESFAKFSELSLLKICGKKNGAIFGEISGEIFEEKDLEESFEEFLKLFR